MPETWGRTSAVMNARVRPGRLASSCWLCVASVTTPKAPTKVGVVTLATAAMRHTGNCALEAGRNREDRRARSERDRADVMGVQLEIGGKHIVQA
jgi:hypothetical protein